MSRRSPVDPVFRENIIDHYRNPRRFGLLDSPDFVRRESNFSCGDDLEFSVRVRKGAIVDVGFAGQGCALSIAAASMLSERAIGMRTADLESMADGDIVAMLGVGQLTGSRLRCATLALKALKGGLADWNKSRK
ncbi:iron-sulfur cluster assembly scaffold protein [Candidatus Uhrbacteria bacterium]|nr:iron-sulfur cluster assembly scaffold protein [Candidatus Uhrbacteria bacterium]